MGWMCEAVRGEGIAVTSPFVFCCSEAGEGSGDREIWFISSQTYFAHGGMKSQRVLISGRYGIIPPWSSLMF